MDRDEDSIGLTYSSTNNKIFYCRHCLGQIYRPNIDGTGVETLQSSGVDCEQEAFAFHFLYKHL